MNMLEDSFWLLIQSDELTTCCLTDALTLACGVWYRLPMARLEAARQLLCSSQQDGRISVLLHPETLIEDTSDQTSISLDIDQLSKRIANQQRLHRQTLDELYPLDQLHIMLSNPMKSDFPVGNWRYPTNQEISVSRDEYVKIRAAIETQHNLPYLPCTTLKVLN